MASLILRLSVAGLFFCILVSCRTVSPNVSSQDGIWGASDPLLTMRELRAAASAAFDSNHLMEGLRDLLGTLAVDVEAPVETNEARRSERAELVRSADAELSAVVARLTLEPTEEWVVKGKQMVGSTRDLSKGRGLRPSVRLLMNYDSGKAVVADGPIAFIFVMGEGKILGPQLTDSFGVASATVHSLVNPEDPALIRGALTLSSRGMTRVFDQVSCEFAFFPSGSVTKIVAMERLAGPTGQSDTVISDTAPLVDAVSRGLSPSGLEIIPSEGSLDPETFMAAFSGHGDAIARLLFTGAAPASYLALALAECDSPRQLSYNGKSYRIYKAEARVTVRLMRGDGSLVASTPQWTGQGQGGSPDVACQAALKSARDAAEQGLSEVAKNLSQTLLEED